MTKTFSTKSVRTQGAAIGYEALPEFYKKDLELHGVIIHVADDLHEGKVSKYH